MKYTSPKERNYYSKINIEEFIKSYYGFIDDKFYYELRYHQFINEIEYAWADKDIIQKTLNNKIRFKDKFGHSDKLKEEQTQESINPTFDQSLQSIEQEVITRHKTSSILSSVIFYKDQKQCSLFESIESVNKIIHEETITPNF